MATRLRGERGQTSAEWMGILLIVAVIITGIATSPVGARIAEGVEVAICRIAGGDCELSESADGKPPLSECVQDSSTRGVSGAVKIFFVELGGGVTGIKEVRADKSVKVTIKAKAEAGLEFSTPGADVEAGGTEAGTGDREVSLSGNGELGKAWTFPNEEAADDFIDDVGDKVKAIADPTPNLPGTSDDADIELPPATETTYAGGVELGAKGELGSGTGLEGNLGAGVGAVYNEDPNSPDFGDKTYFFELKAGGSAGTGGPLEIGGSAEGKTRVAITYDKDGKEKYLRVIGTLDVTGTGSLSAAFEGEDLASFMENAKKLSVSGTDEAGGRLIFDAKLDLRGDPRNLAATRAFLDGVDPATGESVSKFEAGQRLFDRFSDDAVVNGRIYGLTKSSTGADLDLGVFGVSGEYTTEDASLLDAYYRDPVTGGFKRWEECVRGTDS